MATPVHDLSDLEPRRICLIKPSSLGDVVHALPVLTSLRERWPDAAISWVVNRGLTGLLNGHPLLDEVIPFDRSKIRMSPAGFGRFAAFLQDLRSRQFDLTIDLQGLMRSGLMTLATGSPVRIGLRGAREGSRFCYTHQVEKPVDSDHAVDRLLAVARAVGASTQARFTVAICDDDRRWARERLGTSTGDRLVLNVGARWLTKRWPPPHFAEIARRLARTRPTTLIAVGAPEDRPLVDELAEALSPIPLVDLSGRTTLPQLAAVFELADCVLSNDTGPLHLAAAAGARVVGVYTCTSPAKTGPYGPQSLAVSSRIWCAGRCVKTCDRLDCMRELLPIRVESAVRRQLDLASHDRLETVA